VARREGGLTQVARPRLKIGTSGALFTTRRGNYWRARTWFRDYDGKRRLVEATGRTKGIASQRLRNRLAERQGAEGSGEISSNTTINALFDIWLEEIGRGDRTRQRIMTYHGVYLRHG